MLFDRYREKCIELCEQAIQIWLTIWSGNRNDAELSVLLAVITKAFEFQTEYADRNALNYRWIEK